MKSILASIFAGTIVLILALDTIAAWIKAVFTPMAAYVYMETLRDRKGWTVNKVAVFNEIHHMILYTYKQHSRVEAECHQTTMKHTVLLLLFFVPRSNCGPDLNVGFKKLSSSKVLRQRWRHGGLDCN